MVPDGWIKLHRKITSWEWYQDSKMFHLFMHLIMSANHETKNWRGVEVKRGQIIAGRKSLSVSTGISEQSIRTCLEKLEKTKELTIKSTNKYSVITILNYDNFQNREDSNQQLTINQPTTNHQSTTNKNDNNYKNERSDSDHAPDPINPFIHGKKIFEFLGSDDDLQMRISKNTNYADTVIQKKIEEFCERESLNGGKTLNNWRDYCYKSILKNYKNNGTSKPKNRNR